MTTKRIALRQQQAGLYCSANVDVWLEPVAANGGTGGCAAIGFGSAGAAGCSTGQFVIGITFDSTIRPTSRVIAPRSSVAQFSGRGKVDSQWVNPAIGQPHSGQNLLTYFSGSYAQAINGGNFFTTINNTFTSTASGRGGLIP